MIDGPRLAARAKHGMSSYRRRPNHMPCSYCSHLHRQSAGYLPLRGIGGERGCCRIIIFDINPTVELLATAPRPCQSSSSVRLRKWDAHSDFASGSSAMHASTMASSMQPFERRTSSTRVASSIVGCVNALPGSNSTRRRYWQHALRGPQSSVDVERKKVLGVPAAPKIQHSHSSL